MYEVEVEISFPASHQVKLDGAYLEEVHEHNWKVRAKLGGEKLSSQGILVDFILVKQILEEIADKFRGKDLGKVRILSGENPSAENLARCFYQQLEGRFGPEVELVQVAVQEAQGCWAVYRSPPPTRRSGAFEETPGKTEG
ncbi:MAG: hypothetical protein GWP14_10930 [Actinobacteria bacterium]|nr:hypothetical protein [Actinomycetota bacterium]